MNFKKILKPQAILAVLFVLLILLALSIYRTVDEISLVVEKEDDGNSLVDLDKITSEAKKVRLEEPEKITSSDHILGSSSAKVKMIVYSDFECEFCSDYVGIIDKVYRENKKYLAVVFRHFILSSHPKALSAAQALECSAEQGGFWDMYKKLYENNQDGELSQKEYLSDAEELELDTHKFEMCLDSEKYKEKIVNQSKEAEKAGVLGTPTNFINGKIYPGALPYEDYTDQKGVKQSGLNSIVQSLSK